MPSTMVTRSKRWIAALSLAVAGSLGVTGGLNLPGAGEFPVPMTLPEAAAQSTAPLPSLSDAQAAVVAAEAQVDAVARMQTAAQHRLEGLNLSEASLVEQIAAARREMRRWTVDAYTSDRHGLAQLLAEQSDPMERSARLTFASSTASQFDEAVRHYERLKAQVEPALVELADGIDQLAADRQSADNALLAARAMEAEAERLHAEAQRQAAAAKALKTRATQAPTHAQPNTNADADTGAGASSSDRPGDGAVQGAPAPAGGPTEEQWERLRHCEATGNYQAVSASGKYRGAYQFDYQTWATLGPPGDPAAASPAEQDRRARLLYASRGWRPWPQCGRHLR
ncbi:MAG TPA: transglycosylase family protein [Microthrixaceae bacterium]|nr:transglycosylase family protein [Microthrixaceae bacterium]